MVEAAVRRKNLWRFMVAVTRMALEVDGRPASLRARVRHILVRRDTETRCVEGRRALEFEPRSTQAALAEKVGVAESITDNAVL
jgi:hypothetical protein